MMLLLRPLLILLLATMATGPAHAALHVQFGEADLTPNTPVTVHGPLLQLQTGGGTTLSFQQGSRFLIAPGGRITLLSGNLRVGPAGGDTLALTLPQGPATIAPLTALTITAGPLQSSGKVYQGSVAFPTQTFQSGQGFTLTAQGPAATFTPAPAQTPQPQPSLPNTPEQQTSEPTPNSQPEPSPAPPQKSPAEPEPTPEVEPEPELEPQPNPQPNPQPDIISEPTPTPLPPQPEVISTNYTQTNMAIGFSQNMETALAPNANVTTLTFDTFSDDTLAPNSILTSRFGLNPTRLSRGTATLAEWSSPNTTAGVARWVGGDFDVVQNNTLTTLPNTEDAGDDTIPLPPRQNLSLHMVWGAAPTAIPTAGTLTYTLAAATQPTYTNGTPSPGATFSGNLSIAFKPGFSGQVGTYQFTGEVAMPAQSESDSPATYHMATAAKGIALSKNAFASPGTLAVTAAPGAVACPTGTCTGTVNVSGFGAGMAQAGAVYSINPQAPVGITGAALFTAE